MNLWQTILSSKTLDGVYLQQLHSVYFAVYIGFLNKNFLREITNGMFLSSLHDVTQQDCTDCTWFDLLWITGS